MEKMKEKIIKRNCQTCKKWKVGKDDVCRDCSVEKYQPNYSSWEWNEIDVGCMFCENGESEKIGFVEVSIFNIRGKKHLTIDVFDENCLEDECIDEESFDINFCPWCGRKL
jgi:hypothetical protein